MVAPPSFEQGWIAHLQSAFGTAASGGVKLYTLDNEVMLWNSTHRDVHPQPLTYDEIWQRTVAYASAVKAQDPAAQVFGPVTWGYCDLFGSAADNCVDGSDREAHEGKPFVKWYLGKVCEYQAQNGVRLVDVLDLHYYPQGQGVVDFSDPPNGSETATVSARRLRSLKELYAANWESESWVADLGNDPTWHYSRPNLIPRVRAWIDEECPGTRLAITEYSWGADNGASSALAVPDPAADAAPFVATEVAATLAAAGCDAVWIGMVPCQDHPALVAACEHAGMTVIGPDSATIARLADPAGLAAVLKKAKVHGVPAAADRARRAGAWRRATSVRARFHPGPKTAAHCAGQPDSGRHLRRT